MAIMLGWGQRRVGLVLTNTEAWAMVDRARRWDVAAGGRFDLRGGRTIVLWSEEGDAAGERRRAVAAIELAWRVPDAEHATVSRMAWDAKGGVAEEEVWRALELLLGRPAR